MPSQQTILRKSIHGMLVLSAFALAGCVHGKRASSRSTALTPSSPPSRASASPTAPASPDLATPRTARLSTPTTASGGAIRGRVASAPSAPDRNKRTPIVVLAKSLDGRASTKIGTTTLRCRNGALAPSFLVAQRGQEVRFVNDDKICHRFFSSSKSNAFDLGLLKPKASRVQRFERPGLIHIYCSLHSRKQASILITTTPHFAVANEAGDFEIKGLAPGRYQLEVWSNERPLQRLEVTAHASKTPFVEIPTDVPAQPAK